MASELRVNTLKDAAGNNSIATSFVAGGSAKAWVSFNGTGTLSVFDSFNQSSMTDNGTGDYSLVVSNAMSNNDYNTSVTAATYSTTYAGFASAHRNGGTGAYVAPTTTTVRMNTLPHNSYSATDNQHADISIHGDLA